jgi:23S rRNA pseudouridine955/2504/2580 synthase
MKLPPVLYEDSSCLVLNKPAGLAVQGGKGIGVCVDVLLQQAYLSERPLLVHRLDKDTSGVLLTAKGQENAAWYSHQFAGRRAVKRYIAVCAPAGKRLAENGVIEHAVTIHGKEKAASTRYRLLAANEACAVFELELGTGRFHQIRQHLRSIGYPILGDEKYGDWTLNKHLRKTQGLRRMLLHARHLTMPRAGGGSLNVTAPLPPDFVPWLEQTGVTAIVVDGV